MAATLVGSVETMVEALHRPSPQSIRLEAEECQMVVTRVDAKSILVLLAPITVREEQVRMQAAQLAARVRGESANGRRLVSAVPVAPPLQTPSIPRRSQRIA